MTPCPHQYLAPRPVRFLLRAFFALFLLVALFLGHSAHAQSSTRSISLPNQDYTESSTDLSVKVLGGYVVVLREPQRQLDFQSLVRSQDL